MEEYATLIGRTVSHYRIIEKIGAGGMGEVYRAYDERLERDVALKVLHAGMFTGETARKRFRREALALSKLNHPHIATIHDFDTHEGVDFLVMEYVAGETLSDKLRGVPLAEKEIARLGMQLAEGLAAAHEQGIIHRDLKPGNTRLTDDRRLKNSGLWAGHPGAVGGGDDRERTDRKHRWDQGTGRNAAVHVSRTVARRGGRRTNRHLVGRSSAL